MEPEQGFEPTRYKATALPFEPLTIDGYNKLSAKLLRDETVNKFFDFIQTSASAKVL
jgi:hypothetical protein